MQREPVMPAADRAYGFAQASAIGCLVTKEEHVQLTKLDYPYRLRPHGITPFPDFEKLPKGFERYKKAAVAVLDRELGTWLVTTTQT